MLHVGERIALKNWHNDEVSHHTTGSLEVFLQRRDDHKLAMADYSGREHAFCRLAYEETVQRQL
jgi:hypothetical protein